MNLRIFSISKDGPGEYLSGVVLEIADFYISKPDNLSMVLKTDSTRPW